MALSQVQYDRLMTAAEESSHQNSIGTGNASLWCMLNVANASRQENAEEEMIQSLFAQSTQKMFHYGGRRARHRIKCGALLAY